MGFGLRKSGCALLVLLASCLAQSTQTGSSPKAPPPKASSNNGTSKTTAHHTRRKRRTAASARKRGQQKIDSERATEIQQALIREHYLNGKATGMWDDATQKAMQRYQADNGWQSKTTPDSRALIKLGLGPDKGHLLNPESAMTNDPEPRSTAIAPVSTAPNADGKTQ